MKLQQKETFFSSLLFMSAFLLTVFLHEGGHAFFVKYYSIPGQLYHNRVDWDYQTATKEQAIWVCLGGLIISSIQLLIFFPIALKLKQNNRFIQLFTCWFAFWAAVEVLGYLIIGCIPSWNDVAGIYQITGTPWLIRIIVSFSAFFLYRFTLVKLKDPISYSMNPNFSEDPTKQAQTIILYPAIISTVILILLQFPIKYVLSLIYPASIPFFILSLYFKIAKAKTLQFNKNSNLKKYQFIAAVLLFVMLITISRIFASGINI